jgi:pantoate--beta-alanine ligase
MDIARSIADFRAARAALPAPIGFVPTMGYLHAGHTSLMDRAREECASVVASIYVNPTQFGPNEDFERYPRDEAGDLEQCEAHGVDLVVIPSTEEMYPEGASTTVSVTAFADRLEGAHRPGHFDGVATVVAKLFNIAEPDRAYFGQKDAQQLLVIRRLVRDLVLPVEVVGCPIVRDEDGLALSSRNAYLDAEERAQALALSQGLRLAETAWGAGERDADELRRLVRDEIEAQPLAHLEYVSLADPSTLDEREGVVGGESLLSLACRFGGTRLIDNTLLRSAGG